MKEVHKIRLTKSFTFEMAHALTGYDGACKNLHGHSFRLEVTVRGTPLQHPGHPKDGMVMDFKDLKKVVQGNVLDVFDHALALNESTPRAVVQAVEVLADHVGVEQRAAIVPHERGNLAQRVVLHHVSVRGVHGDQ